MKLKTNLFYSCVIWLFNYLTTSYNFCRNQISFISEDRLSWSEINPINVFNVISKCSKCETSKFDVQFKSLFFIQGELIGYWTTFQYSRKTCFAFLMIREAGTITLCEWLLKMQFSVNCSCLNLFLCGFFEEQVVCFFALDFVLLGFFYLIVGLWTVLFPSKRKKKRGVDRSAWVCDPFVLVALTATAVVCWHKCNRIPDQLGHFYFLFNFWLWE